MKLRPLEAVAEPATISGVKDNATHTAQALPAQKRALLERRAGTSSRDSNIQSKLNGMRAADANPRRPRRMLGSESLVDRYRDIGPTQPMIVTIEKAKRRFTRARGSRSTTTRARQKSTAQRVRVPIKRRST